MPTPTLRVAHLMQHFAVGGLERMVQTLATGAQHKGVQGLVIGYLGDGPIRAELEASGVRTAMLAEGDGLSARRLAQVGALLRREQIDVLHTHHLGPFVYGALPARLCGVRCVHTEHSHELYDAPRRRWLGALMPRLSHVVAVTPEIARFRQERLGRGCDVIRNGVALPACDEQARARARARLGVDEHTFVVGCVARLAKEKDHATLLEAFAQLLTSIPKALLVVAGDGPERAALHARCARLGLDRRVRWLGACDHVAALYPAFDACALASRREGLPLALLEAMAHGLPVVATAVGGVPELLEAAGGMLVAPGNAPALAGALRAIAVAPQLARKLGGRGRELVQQRYGQEQMVERYVALYRTLADATPAPHAALESSACA